MLLSSFSSKQKFISICHELCLYVVAINLCIDTSIASFSSKQKFISICHELCLYVVAINLCIDTSIALFYCTVVRSEHI